MTTETQAPDPARAVIERDEQMDRDYIPLPGGWEVQTKGKGSTLRLLDKKTGERHPLPLPDFIIQSIERMAREVHAASAIPAPEGAQLPEPHGMKWRNKKTGATGVYFEDPRQFGINTEHPNYEWTPIYTADQLRAALAAPRVAEGALRAAAQGALAVLDSIGQQDMYAEEWAAVEALRAALAAPAPQATDAELERRTGEPHVDGWPLVSGLPAPQALTVQQIIDATVQIDVTQPAWIVKLARAIEAAHGIPAPQTKEPTNDR